MVVTNLPGEMQELYSFASLSATNIWAEEGTPVLWSGVSQAAGSYWEPVLCWGGFRSAGGCGPQPCSPVPRCLTRTTPSQLWQASLQTWPCRGGQIHLWWRSHCHTVIGEQSPKLKIHYKSLRLCNFPEVSIWFFCIISTFLPSFIFSQWNKFLKVQMTLQRQEEKFISLSNYFLEKVYFLIK